jgi:hypothetical protein
VDYHATEKAVSHTYPSERAGYYRDEPINLPRFPIRLYSAICPRCLALISGRPPDGVLALNPHHGCDIIERILAIHTTCEWK